MKSATGRLTKALGHLHDADDAINELQLGIEAAQIARGEQNESKQLDTWDDLLTIISGLISDATRGVNNILESPTALEALKETHKHMTDRNR